MYNLVLWEANRNSEPMIKPYQIHQTLSFCRACPMSAILRASHLKSIHNRSERTALISKNPLKYLSDPLLKWLIVEEPEWLFQTNSDEGVHCRGTWMIVSNQTLLYLCKPWPLQTLLCVNTLDLRRPPLHDLRQTSSAWPLANLLGVTSRCGGILCRLHHEIIDWVLCFTKKYCVRTIVVLYTHTHTHTHILT